MDNSRFRIAKVHRDLSVVNLFYGESTICHVDEDKITDEMLRVAKQSYASGYSDAMDDVRNTFMNADDTIRDSDWIDERPERDEEAE